MIGAGINLAMRTADASQINQGWINLQEAGVTVNRNELAARLINSLREALPLFEQEGLTPFVARWAALITLLTGRLSCLSVNVRSMVLREA